MFSKPLDRHGVTSSNDTSSKIAKNHFVKKGHNHLLEIRLLKTGFLILFQLNPQIRWVVFDVCHKKKNFSKEIKKYFG
jgi:hypothetical protein